jgi:hypothetical protein
MKRRASVLAIVLVMLAIGASSGVAQADGGTVTAAIEAVLAGPTLLAGVPVDGLTVGTGVLINPDGSAIGAFHAVLGGLSAAGTPQRITLDGKVSTGSMAPGGQANFAGIAAVDLGDGTAALPSVPFSVTATADSVLLAVDVTTLPAAAVSAGAIAIE